MKTLHVSKADWQRLTLLKMELDLRSLGEVVSALLDRKEARSVAPEFRPTPRRKPVGVETGTMPEPEEPPEPKKVEETREKKEEDEDIMRFQKGIYGVPVARRKK